MEKLNTVVKNDETNEEIFNIDSDEAIVLTSGQTAIHGAMSPHDIAEMIHQLLRHMTGILRDQGNENRAERLILGVMAASEDALRRIKNPTKGTQLFLKVLRRIVIEASAEALQTELEENTPPKDIRRMLDELKEMKRRQDASPNN